MKTSKNLFADWYRETDINPTSSVVDMRLQALETIVDNNSDIEFWLTVIKLYLGYKAVNINLKDEFCKEFKNVDSTFPMIDNEQLVRILAASALCMKLENEDAFETDTIALGLITSNYLSQFSLPNKIPVLKLATTYLENESIRYRKGRSNGYVDETKIIYTPTVIEDDNEVLYNSDMKKPVDAINNVIVEVLKRVESISKEFLNLQVTNEILSEEINVLWWVFGEYSNYLKKPFKDISIHSASFLSGLELSELVKQSPGFITVQPLIEKVLKVLQIKDKNLPASSLFEAVNSLTEDIREKINKAKTENMLVFTPAFAAVNKSLNVESSEDWSNLFKKQIGADPKQKKAASSISLQVYHEFQFLNSYQHCS